jgi:glycosyltransferase involved in cell wall biosynthesis
MVAGVIATSTDIAAEATAAGFNDVTVVPNGVVFGPVPPRRPEGFVAAVGRINDWKGHDVLIRAVAELRQRGVDIEARIAGDPYPGDEQQLVELEDLAATLAVDDRVQFLGYVQDIADLMSRASVFVAPSTRPEPFGIALLDALAAGVPCVASAPGGPREMIRDGETGLLVPSGDVTALADAIESLVLDRSRAESMGTAAAGDVRMRFSIDHTARRVGEVYAEVLGTRTEQR